MTTHDSSPRFTIADLSGLSGGSLPDSAVVVEAIELAREHSEPWLLNHAMRSWLFSTHIAAIKGWQYDAEAVAVASVLHDLGLTAAHGGTNRFEVHSADAARAFLATSAPTMETHRRQLVWDSIALHATSSIAQHKQPEVSLVNSGIIMDYSGSRKDEIAASTVAAILQQFPRLRMKEAFTSCLIDLAQKRPTSTYGTWVADFGVRFVPGYEPPSSVDALNNAPYPE